jgi:uroporphyrinogen-III synthase
MKPLAGRRVLVTRARHQAGAFHDALQALGAQVVFAPVIEIVPPDSYAPLDHALLDLGRYDWLILTSTNGVAALWGRVRALGLPSTWLQSTPLVAIGPATAQALEQHGWKVALMPKEYVAEALVEALREQIAGKRVLLVRAKVARDVVPEELARLGAQVDIVEAYQTVMPHGAEKQIRTIFADPARHPKVITFTSSSTVKNFFTLLHEAGLATLPEGIVVASIGPITSQTLHEHGVTPEIEAEDHSTAGLIAAIAAYFQAQQQ